ncbi:MAG: hypothetical protein HKN32_04630, partial [Flavobacteriales bacterium]|nr:hypothetical protein [Flavobacteriales bacterium]
MNKLYALIAVVMVSSSAFAQVAQDNLPPMMQFSKDQVTPIVTPRGENPVVEAMRATDILFEDFQAGGPELPAGWVGVDVTSDVDGPLGGELTPAFIVGDAADANSGGYWPVPDLPGNTFALANDDGPPCDCDMFLVTLTTPEVSLADAQNPAVSFDIFHDMGFGGGDAGVEVSVDGGATWEVLVDVLPVEESVWQTIIVPVYDYVGNAQFQVRFFWSDAGSWASGFAVDNVGIGSLADYNASAAKSAFGNWNLETFQAGVYDFSMVPESQVSPL